MRAGRARAELLATALEIANAIAAKSPLVIRRAKESLNGIEAVDVKRAYRYEQGFTFEVNLWGDSDELRQAFVDKRDADLGKDAEPLRYKAVIFDLGGVVFGSPFEHFDAYERTAGLPTGSVRTVIATAASTARGPRSNGASSRCRSSAPRSTRKAAAEGHRDRRERDHGDDRTGHRRATRDDQRDRADPRARPAHRRAHEQLARRRRQRIAAGTAVARSSTSSSSRPSRGCASPIPASTS